MPFTSPQPPCPCRGELPSKGNQGAGNKNEAHGPDHLRANSRSRNQGAEAGGGAGKVLMPQHTRRWGKACPFLTSQERRIQPRAITLGSLPVCVTLGHCEAVKCPPGDKSPLQVFGQLTLIIINLFKLNVFLVLLKWIRKKYITSKVQTLPSGMFSWHPVGLESMHKVQNRLLVNEVRITLIFLKYYPVNYSTSREKQVSLSRFSWVSIRLPPNAQGENVLFLTPLSWLPVLLLLITHFKKQIYIILTDLTFPSIFGSLLGFMFTFCKP